MKNRRDERKELNFPVQGTVKIYKFGNKCISNRNALINIENISLNGLRFSSNLEFPITKEMTLCMEFEVFGLKKQLVGTLVWKRKDTNKFIYGIEIVSANMGYIQSVGSLTTLVHTVKKVVQ
ncbi:PilZ domain-containing protein [Domibacillus tundrae]|uniref:PilZ domain-containing protein n=1 Tax=Domibacillus tundrae TaxID=1587527 RepID=UPI0006181A7A|nr:PilZ domain-containing protein [Domibacillus tundrae]